MPLQFVLGPSGAGKSHTVYNRMIAEATEHPAQNYILLVPEQYSLALQRKLVWMHPCKGTMNIDVIGFNRLAYRLFDEQNIKPGRVLEDFGKTMLIREVAEQVKDSLSVYGGCLDKSGFIDEVKSLMSEMYQYDLSKERLETVLKQLEDVPSERLLYSKLRDMLTIFQAFDERLSDTYIVAEQLTELLARMIPQSALIRNSTIVFDGFTGFTPIQRKVIRELFTYARDVKVLLTIDRKSYEKGRLPEHALFYLTSQTMELLRSDARECHVTVAEDLFIDADKKGRWREGPLSHLEKNLFRYPYRTFDKKQDDINVVVYDNPAGEIFGVAERILSLVRNGGYRFHDIAVISGELEKSIGHVDRIFPMYGIPYFLDYSRPVKNNPYIDALEHALAVCEENFSYDSVFAFLKAGVVETLSDDDIERLENCVLSCGIKGFSWWQRSLEDTWTEEVRVRVMEILTPFYTSISKKEVTVSEYVEAIYRLFDVLHYGEKLENEKGLYSRICEMLDKMLEIMADDTVSVSAFAELLSLGLSDLTLGMIPNSLDSVIVGDITRTRLSDIRVLFVVGVNDGILPKKGTPAQIISDREKERLAEYSFCLAPTEKINAYIEQFYLYINMTKPMDKLYLSYTQMNSANEVMRPSYMIGRIKNLFPAMEILHEKETERPVTTEEASTQILISGLRELMEGDEQRLPQTLALYRLYMESQDSQTARRIRNALSYNNIPKQLEEEVAKLIRVKLLSQSVSRLERYAQCAYAYFLQYILEIGERGIKRIDSRSIGTIMHAAMESLYRHVHDNFDNAWERISEADCDAMAERFVCEAFAKEYAEQLAEDARYTHLQDTLVRVGKRTARRLAKIGSEDLLKPEYFEYNFEKKLPLDSSGENMTLRGVVDRMDVHYDSDTGKLFLRVIDYKSGNYDFRISELYEGLQLQLSVYMDVMEQLVTEQYKKKGTADVTVVPEGMYYYRMQDPYIEADDAEDAEKKRDKQLVPKGLKQTDEKFFRTVTDYAKKKMKDLAGDMLDGKIDKAPIVRGGASVCAYCAYADVCRFDEKFGGNRYRYLRYKDSEKDSIYVKMQEEMGGACD